MKRLSLFLLAIAMLISFTGCPLQVNPSIEMGNYETFGQNLGTFFKTTDPEFAEESETWVKGALELSNAEILDKNILQTAYKYAMKNKPEDAPLILLTKQGIDTFGIKIDASKILPEDRPKYAKCVRVFLKGYLEAVK